MSSDSTGPVSIQVDKAIAADCAAVALCARNAYQQYVEAIGKKPAPMCADFAQLIEWGFVDVARVNGRLAGFIVLYACLDKSAGEHLFIENIAVLTEMSGKGIGKQLMNYAESVARAEALPKIRLYTNVKMTGNLEWYPKLGFVETSRVEESGFSRVYFEKYLD